MLLVDSTIWVDFFNGTETRLTNYLHDSLGKTHILVGDLIIAEVLQGFRQDSDFERAHVMLTKFTIVNMLNPVIAIQSARNYRFLRHHCP